MSLEDWKKHRTSLWANHLLPGMESLPSEEWVVAVQQRCAQLIERGRNPVGITFTGEEELDRVGMAGLPFATIHMMGDRGMSSITVGLQHEGPLTEEEQWIADLFNRRRPHDDRF